MRSIEAQGPAGPAASSRFQWRSSLRHRLHILLADVLYFTGILPLWLAWQKTFGKSKVWTFALHRVLSAEQQKRTDSPSGMLMEQATFAALLQYLKQHFSILRVEECFPTRALDGHGKPACVITFDDGWGDNYDVAYPELKKQSIPATIFLTTGYIDGKTYPWWEGLCSRRHELRGPPLSDGGNLDGFLLQVKHMRAAERAAVLASAALVESYRDKGRVGVDRILRWEEVQEMARDGIEIGAHTVTHPLLTVEDATMVASEIAGSKAQIERWLGMPIRAFAYPGGAWNRSVRQAVAEAGYQVAFTSEFGPYRKGMDQLTVPRIMLHQGRVTGKSGQFSRAMLLLTLTGWDRRFRKK
jgi:peptidoglycan/xylan/chitin deacetylase (PgdA/CDA1 family)